MSRYIDADELKKNLDGVPYTMLSVSAFQEMLEQYTTANVQEIKRGRWEQDGTGLYARCSVCKERTYLGGRQNYCPNCGAKMDEVDKNGDEITE